MTSQSPPGNEPTPEYKDAWATLQYLVLEEGGSWSGNELNFLYLNLGDRRFADVSAVSATNYQGDGRCIVSTDWDEDGKLDLILKNRTAPRILFFHNRHPGDENFLAVDLRGVRCNRDAIGALVTVEAGGRTLRQSLRAGEGYLAQSSKRLHFGLGDAQRVETLTVRWPDGSVDSYRDLPAGARLAIEQGAREPRTISPRVRAALAKLEPEPLATEERKIARLALLEKLPVAALRVPGFEAPERRIADLAGGPVLLNLWSKDCAGCQKESSEFRERDADLRASGLRLVVLTVDPPEAREEARERLRRLGLERDAGFVDDAFVRALQVLLETVIGRLKEVPLPTSLLLDERGALVVAYLGPLDVHELLEDVRLLRTLPLENPSAAKLSFGRRLTARHRDLMPLARKLEQAGLAQLAASYREAARHER